MNSPQRIRVMTRPGLFGVPRMTAIGSALAMVVSAASMFSARFSATALVLSALLVIGGCGGGGGQGGGVGGPGAGPGTCTVNGTKITDGVLPPGSGKNLEITKGECTAGGTGMYMYGNVNIYDGGALKFLDSRGADTQFWANSILIENNGSLLAGSTAKPFGVLGGKLTIYVYGKDTDKGIPCKIKKDEANDIGPCGVPLTTVWNSNADPSAQPKTTKLIPGVPEDYFYNYDFMPFDNGEPDAPSYFGNKVLAVSFGGTLKLFGKKGASYSTLKSSDSGISWARLKGSIEPAPSPKGTPVPEKFLTVDVGKVDNKLNWEANDHIVVTTTDYMPDHSEELIIKAQPTDNKDGTFTIQYENANPSIASGVQWSHNGQTYPLGNDTHKGIDRLKLGRTMVETRAAVGLLTRSIKIYSGGNTIGKKFDDEASTYTFGAHTIARQGFAAFQMQGVELGELGQGGLIGHYAVHFHMARKTPNDTFVRDCSIWDSMTRWIVLHATQGVELSRNVGYKSIGSGFFIEDGTETNNKLYSNLGVFARAAVDNVQNPRKVPGILADTYTDRPNNLAYDSDYDYPSVFWIMNGWNDFEYNMAAGAETCGSCYWLVPGANSGQENTGMAGKPNSKMTWTGYAAMQGDLGRAATTPLMKFVGNSCASAMNSFQTVANINACNSVGPPDTTDGRMPVIANPKAPKAKDDVNLETYYPRLGNNRPATQCGSDPKAAETANCGDAGKYPICTSGKTANCLVTVLDDYTTSFNWAETNFAAVWLRQYWYLFINSAITDVQNAGLTMITSGDYTRSAVIDGYWSLAKKDVFIGHTQNVVLGDKPVGNPYASSVGPFNPTTKLQCDKGFGTCFSRDDGLEMPAANFAVNQRFFNIYDGPSYQDSNGFLDISLDDLPCEGGECNNNDFFKTTYGRSIGIPKDKGGKCYLPNAAIAWKQPNGFFYPPAFHSANLYFDKVPLRHLVIEPLLDKNRKTDTTKIAARYCSSNDVMFDNFNDIDRQTVVNDDDGSLTGLVANPVEANERNEPKPDSADEEIAEKETISVNFGSPFFTNPIQAPECKSEIDNPPASFPPATCKTIPYEFFSTVVYPGCAKSDQSKPAPIKGQRCGYGPPPDTNIPQDPDWNSDCTNTMCYGVPLYRQGLINGEAPDDTQSIRMMGGNLWQRQSMTANNGTYYIDTAAGEKTQKDTVHKNIFDKDKTYYVFFLYAKPTLHQVYQLYVGSGFDAGKNVFLTRVTPNATNFTFIDDVDSDGNPNTLPKGWSAIAKDGILTVTVDMGFPEFATNYTKAQGNFCAPASFCKLDGGKCGCNPSSPNFDLCKNNDVCAMWAGKDVDWPDGGAYGFGVRFTGFVADDMNHRPPTSCIKMTDTGWNAPLERTSADLQGDCSGTPIPATQFCP